MKKHKILFGVVFILFILFLNGVSAGKEDKKELTTYVLEPSIYSNSGVWVINRFNLGYERIVYLSPIQIDLKSRIRISKDSSNYVYPLKEYFYIKGWFYPSNKWDSSSFLLFQFPIDSEYTLRETQPEPIGIPRDYLPIDKELSFLATDYSAYKWINQTYIKDFGCNGTQFSGYKINLDSNKLFFDAIKENKKSVYFEIYFDFNDRKIKINDKELELNMKGKKELYVILSTRKFQEDEEISFFGLKFKGKVIKGYYPEYAFIEKDFLKCVIGSSNYGYASFLIHVSLDDMPPWYEKHWTLIALIFGFIGLSDILYRIVHRMILHKAMRENTKS